MSDIELDWDGDDPEELRDDLDTLADAVNEKLYEAVETWSLLVESTAKQLAPVDTGRLRSSINSEARRIGKDIVKGFIGSNLDYAPIIEEGRGSIEASGDSPLRFVIDGEVIYRWSVGPAEAQPFLENAMMAHIQDLRDLCKEAINDAVAEVRVS